jgi:crotonobetainyl-CoA:carnitine CoA-transferase CaiB-like acyl-CoA transferase
MAAVGSEQGGAARPGPMEGIKVVELAMWAAGPVVGALLSDWGAAVIKIESPQGDPFRSIETGDAFSEDYMTSQVDNRNKRSLALDLRTPGGLVILHQLLAQADVFVTNFRQGALQRLGLAYEDLCGRYPRLIYALLTGYGTQGPDINRPAYDAGTWWGRAGVAMTLLSDGAVPMFHAGAIGDHFTGFTLAGGIGAALYARERTGEGQMLDVSMLRSAAYFLSSPLCAHLNGRPPRKSPRDEVANMLVMPYLSKDGKWFYLLGTEPDRLWPLLAKAVGRPQWADDPRYKTFADRAKRRAEVIAELDAVFAQRSRDEWAALFDREGVWWTPVQTVEELPDDPQMREAGCFVTVPTRWGDKQMVPGPVNFNGSPGRLKFGSPAVGQHNDEILRELGRSAEQVAQLRKQGVIP